MVPNFGKMSRLDEINNGSWNATPSLNSSYMKMVQSGSNSKESLLDSGQHLVNSPGSLDQFSDPTHLPVASTVIILWKCLEQHCPIELSTMVKVSLVCAV